MRRNALTILAVAAVALGLSAASCGDDKKTEPTPTSENPPTADIVRVEVVDGDTRAPIAGATVEPIPSTGQAIPPVQSDTSGVAAIPTGMDGVCASIANRVKECRTIVSDRNTVTVPLYDPALQSPEYGGTSARTRYVPAVRVPPPAGPPAWSYKGKALLEFPPAVARGTVVLTTNRGRVIAFNSRTGGIRWQKRHTTTGNIASTAAITPDGQQVIVSGMDGRLVSYAFDNGRINWEFNAGRSPIESSPLVVGNLVYVGAHNGLMYAVTIDGGKQKWKYQAADDIKSGAALSGANLIFGDYSGNVYAVRASDGTLVWRVNVGKRFYGGAAISKGIAVLGDVGGGVVALNANTGRQLWRHSTGGAIVYASPAIANDTVFIGSYNEQLYALNLRTGAVRWSRDVGGRIGGSATVVGNTVYTSVLARRGEKDRTYGLDTRSGKIKWTGTDGRYTPAVGAGRSLYITGRTSLYAYPAS